MCKLLTKVCRRPFRRRRVQVGLGVTDDQARRAGEYLARRGVHARARLQRDGDTYQLFLAVSLGQPDPVQDLACEVLAAGFCDEVCGGAATEIHICDRTGHVTSVVPHRWRLGRRLAMNATVLFYTDGVTRDDAFQLTTFLAYAGVINDSPKVMQFDRIDQGYELRVAVDVDPLPAEMEAGARRMADDLSHRVFRGAPVSVRYTFGLKNTLKLGPPHEVPLPGESEPGPYRAEIFHVPRARAENGE
jgi:hypothetical protein